MVRPVKPSEDLVRSVTHTMGDQIVKWTPVQGGYSAAGLWVIATNSGVKRFVKAATSDNTARFLREEAVVYENLVSPFMPEVEAWVDDGDRPFLIIEDLSDLHWPPPWSSTDIQAVREVCDAIATASHPPGLGREAQAALDHMFWTEIAATPNAIYGLGVASPAWFEDVFPVLIEIEKTAVLTGDGFVHGDIRSDNLCVGEQVKVIDWNWAFVGNPMVDVVAWLPSLHLEGGPAPWELLEGQVPLVARLAGYFLQHATLRPRPDVRDGVRHFQRAQGTIALQWLAHELDLRPPTS